MNNRVFTVTRRDFNDARPWHIEEHSGPVAVAGNEADARLLAAAPDLLAALRLALATLERVQPSRPFDSTQGTRDVAAAAIAKAEGR